MLQILKKSQFIIMMFLTALLIIYCGPDDLCGGGKYQCTDILSTYPEQPAKYDEYTNSILFSDGTFWKKGTKFRPNQEISINLNELCDSDSISDIIFFDDRFSNNDGGEDERIVVVTPLKCCTLEDWDSIGVVFGNIGEVSETLVDAVSADVNLFGHFFIVDRGDNSVKVFDNNGEFLAKWNDLENPSKIEVYGSFVYILENYNTIKMYDFDGTYLETTVEGDTVDDIVTFKLVGNGELLIADYGGRRVIHIDNEGNFIEVKYDYCFKDVSFSFKKVMDLSYFSSTFSDDGFIAVDAEANYILWFEDVAYAI